MPISRSCRPAPACGSRNITSWGNRRQLESLSSLLHTPDLPRDLIITAYHQQADILSRAERYQKAADTYAALPEA
ncbi:MAG: hypothetical protein R3B83_02630 [Nitrospirales bacterium]|nr:hypothetical protein [Nitrospirales bacterium]